MIVHFAHEFLTLKVSLVSRIRSPKPSQSKVVKSTTERLANENRGKVATNEQSEGVLTETEDIDIESSTAARTGVHCKDFNQKSCGKLFHFKNE